MMDEEYRLYRPTLCPRCDETIEDDPVSYVEPIEIEGFGVMHGWCAEEIVEEASRSESPREQDSQ